MTHREPRHTASLLIRALIHRNGMGGVRRISSSGKTSPARGSKRSTRNQSLPSQAAQCSATSRLAKAENDPYASGSAPRVRGSGPRDTRPRARQLRTYMRPCACAHNNGFPGNGRCASACWPTRPCPTDSGRAPGTRSCIGPPEGPRERRHSARPGLTVATMGRGSLTEGRALGQERTERNSPRAGPQLSPGACGTAPETAATIGRRSFPRPSPLSTGSRIASRRFRRPKERRRATPARKRSGRLPPRDQRA